MAIRTVVTRGFGNGTFAGTIAAVALRGFITGATATSSTIIGAATVTQAFPTHDDTTFNLFASVFGNFDFGGYLLNEDFVEDQFPLMAAANLVLGSDTIFNSSSALQAFSAYDDTLFNLPAMYMGGFDFGFYLISENTTPDNIPIMAAADLSGGL